MSKNLEEKAKILQQMKAQEQAQQQAETTYWADVYPTLSLEDRKAVWLQQVTRQVQQQATGVGEREFYLFTFSNYQKWTAKYTDMDVILDHVIDHLADLYQDETLVVTLNQQLGRTR